ncbi:MAG: hypothetical protein FGF51_03330 [Candidatus Brockarchaeota archaeon]|nr:hypothetical protein [Candidatus Brockarchaeota archaeon]MBO3809854.1 hypothetical protein [Candidatus Brockarchaeota archaeon]MBO3832403.1 hypothetical protein [Candidatus Brockarchaeota archaeon]MBO3842130.1 hypothetical protein [Candidatus Brockarchaeota archaeon]
MGRAKRHRLQLYADILRVLKVHGEGCGITRLSYGANMPLDRVKKLVGELASHGLIGKRTDDPRIFVLTARGMEFLDAFDKLAIFLE